MNKLVLIVDDEPHMLKLAEYSLRPGGYRFIFGSDGAQIMDIAKRERPDLVITDVRMAQMDGLTALKQLRADEDTRGIPVVVVTGMGCVQSDEPKLFMDADAVIMKPYGPTQLLSTVQALLAA